MLEVLYATGMRVSELINLTLERVDLNMKYIIAFGKGSKERIVPLGSVAAEFLQQYLEKVRPKLTHAGRNTNIVFWLSAGMNLRASAFGRLSVLRQKSKHQQSAYPAYSAPFVCHAPFGQRCRPAQRAGAFRAF